MSGNLDWNTLLLLIVAVMTLANTIYARRTEKNTNSLVTRLVASTAAESHAAGAEQERLKGEVKAAALAEGQAQAQKK